MLVKKYNPPVENEFNEVDAATDMGLRTDSVADVWDELFQCDTVTERNGLINFLEAAKEANKTPVTLHKIFIADEKENIVMVTYSIRHPIIMITYSMEHPQQLDLFSWVERNISGIVEEFLTRFKKKYGEALKGQFVCLSDIVEWANGNVSNSREKKKLKSVVAATSSSSSSSSSSAAASAELKLINKNSFKILMEMEVISKNAIVGQIAEKNVYEEYVRREAIVSAFIGSRVTKGNFFIGQKVSTFFPNVSLEAYDTEYVREQNKPHVVKAILKFIDDTDKELIAPKVKKIINFDDIVKWANWGEDKSKSQKEIRDKIRQFLKDIGGVDVSQKKIKPEAILKAYEKHCAGRRSDNLTSS